MSGFWSISTVMLEIKESSGLLLLVARHTHHAVPGPPFQVASHRVGIGRVSGDGELTQTQTSKQGPEQNTYAQCECWGFILVSQHGVSFIVLSCAPFPSFWWALTGTRIYMQHGAVIIHLVGVLTRGHTICYRTGLQKLVSNFLLISLQTRSLMLGISFQLIKSFGGRFSQGEEEWVMKSFALTTFYHLTSALSTYPVLVYTRIILFQVSNYRLICIVREAGFDDLSSCYTELAKHKIKVIMGLRKQFQV